MKKLVIANWKMNPATPAEAKFIFAAIKKATVKMKTEVIVCPPLPFLGILGAFVYPKGSQQSSRGRSRVLLGAQDLSRELPSGGVGALTGEASGTQIYAVGARRVIVGHSERRALGETDEIINKKIKAALRSGLGPILCIGESKRDDAGNYLHFIRKQLELDLSGVNKSDLKNIVIAYEPVWAIGKQAKREAMAEECREIVIFIKKVLADFFGRKQMEKVKIIYGGSVNEKNARDYVTIGQADGLLIGRESLRPEKFKGILRVTQH